MQPNLIQLEYLWFCSDKIDVFSVMCAAMISVLAIYMLSYMEILTCFVWCLLILFYYVIKMKIKQLKIFFFCLYFNPVLSRNSFTTCTSVLQMYIVGNLVQRNSTCILYFGDVTFWLCRTSDILKYFLHFLGLWDNEVDLYLNTLHSGYKNEDNISIKGDPDSFALVISRHSLVRIKIF